MAIENAVSRMWRRVRIDTTDVSEEYIASIIRVENFSALEIALAIKISC